MKFHKLVPRGMLKFNILKLLKKGPKHGYEIMKLMEEETGWEPSPGALYPTLHQLKKKKLQYPQTLVKFLLHRKYNDWNNSQFDWNRNFSIRSLLLHYRCNPIFCCLFSNNFGNIFLFLC